MTIKAGHLVTSIYSRDITFILVDYQIELSEKNSD